MSSNRSNPVRDEQKRQRDVVTPQLQGLQKAIDKPLEDKGTYDNPQYLLDNVTREEISGLIRQRKLGEATRLWNSAKKGVDAKFKARTETQHLYETLLDQPGAAQTRSASLLDAYKGQR